MYPFSKVKTNITRALFVMAILIICVTLFLSKSSVAHGAGASIKLSLTSGPSTTKIKVSGKGFSASELVTITFDSTSVGTCHDWQQRDVL